MIMECMDDQAVSQNIIRFILHHPKFPLSYSNLHKHNIKFLIMFI